MSGPQVKRGAGHGARAPAQVKRGTGHRARGTGHGKSGWSAGARRRIFGRSMPQHWGAPVPRAPRPVPRFTCAGAPCPVPRAPPPAPGGRG